jgi:NTE family protein
VSALRRSLNRIYDLGAFDLVDFRVAPGEQGNELLIQPRDRSAGPVRIRSGLTLFSDLDGDSDFNFLTSVTATELNAQGAEWTNQVQFGRTSRVFSEWYQPLDRARAFFFAGNAEYLQDRVEADNAAGALFRAKYRSVQVGADFGAQLANFGELRVGPVWSRTNVYELLGTTLPGGITQATQAGMRLRLMLDQFDNVNFPRSGYFGGMEVFASRREMGAEQNHNRTSAAWTQAMSFGRNTFVAGAEFNAKLGPDLPFYENFALGGFLNLSGYPFGGISDQYSGLARLIYYRRVAGSGSPLLGSLYAGGSLESGGVWHRAGEIGTKGMILAGSVFVGADTVLGPFYLAYGQAERGNRAFYFYLGRGF